MPLIFLSLHHCYFGAKYVNSRVLKTTCRVSQVQEPICIIIMSKDNSSVCFFIVLVGVLVLFILMFISYRTNVIDIVHVPSFGPVGMLAHDVRVAAGCDWAGKVTSWRGRPVIWWKTVMSRWMRTGSGQSLPGSK